MYECLKSSITKKIKVIKDRMNFNYIIFIEILYLKIIKILRLRRETFDKSSLLLENYMKHQTIIINTQIRGEVFTNDMSTLNINSNEYDTLLAISKQRFLSMIKSI